MGQLDENKSLKGNGYSLQGALTRQQNVRERSAAMDVLSSGVGSITSRDQIINPMDLINPSMYKNTRAGRALYESDLAALSNLQSQQEAAYQEWYDSPEQAALRERAAGLNPDLVGLENAGESAEAAPSDAVPGQNLMTNGEIALNALSGISSLISSVATIAALPSSISAAKSSAKASDAAAKVSEANALAINLDTIQRAEASYAAAASNILADAIAADPGLDVASFMSDMNNFEGLFDTFAPGVGPSHPLYSSMQGAFKRGISSVQKARAGAMGINTAAATGQTEFAKALSNKYYDPNLLLQLALVEPLANKEAELYELDLQFSILNKQFENAKLDSMDGTIVANSIMDGYRASSAEYKFKKDYFDGFEGNEVAALEFAMQQYQEIIMSIDAGAKSNLESIWKDESRGMNERLSAFYNLCGNTHSSFAEFAVMRYPALAQSCINAYADGTWSNARNAKIEPFIRIATGALGAATTFATFGK